MSSRSGSADTFNPRATTDSAQRPSTLRPRRLISFTDDDGNDTPRQPPSTGLSTMRSSELPSVRSRGATPSPRPSRTVSPIPMGHPSRVTQPRNGPRSGNSLDFLDASWSSLQSIASSLLGSDMARPTANGIPRSHARKPSRADSFSRMPPRTSTWGPSAPLTPEIGAGTQEERQALVQAKKREALLLADTGPSWNLDFRHKRRDSNDREAHSEIDAEQDEEALVYVHRVQPTDSITGVTIRYGCQAAIFRKANGFWPSDSIHVRKTVLLPVDCCSVKGRPTRPQEKIDLLDELPRRRSIEDPSGSSIYPASTPDTSPGPSEQTTTESEIENDQIWKHESWVQIDGFSAPVEIGRVPRRALGFFPRSRRKSLCYSDSEPVRGRVQTPTISTASSPSQTASPQLNDQQDRLNVGSPGARKPAWSRPSGRHRRQQSGLELSGTGVGTLDGTINIPGPAMDGLSKFFAQHMPNLAPKQAPTDFDSLNQSSSSVVSNAPTSLDNIGGAVEGWVRKMTARAKSSINDLQQASNPPNQGLPPDTGRRGLGDLIELDDGMESRNSASLLTGTKWTDFNRSGSNLHDGGSGSLRGRFPSASPSTSRTCPGPDRLKDD
ncbi:hypothetical protein BJY04DRAFT_131247 [Aspergillus karnatakaensis]|uniref:putative LysM domain protein n=1 Tax=Aspergillus karnatakaensis TaxID=1810916 RepID=UPI003CCCC595